MEWFVLRDILYLVIGLIIGLVIGFFVSRKVTKKYLKENRPINEQIIIAMMSGMRRTPSQKQINQMIK